MKQVKVVILGPKGAGKTTFIKSLCQNPLSIEAKDGSTLVFDYDSIRYNGLKVHLFSTPGHRRYKVIRDIVAKGANGVIFIIDSVRGVNEGDLELLGEIRRKGIPVVVCANKQDLEGHLSPREVEKLVDGLPVIPTVAKDGTGCREALRTLLSLVKEGLDRVAPS